MMSCSKCNATVEDGRAVCLQCGHVIAEHEQSVTLKALRQKIARFLQRAGASYVETDGEFFITRGTAGVVLSLGEFDDQTFLDFHGAIVSEIKPSPEQELELYRKLLTWNVAEEFGKFALLDQQVILKYRLIANEMSFDTFCFVTDSVLEYADTLDELVAEMANGKRHADKVTA